MNPTRRAHATNPRRRFSLPLLVSTVVLLLCSVVLVVVLGASVLACTSPTDLAAANPRVPAAGAIVAFVGVSVIPMDRDTVLADQTVIVDGARIAAIGPASGTTVPAGARRVDARGKYLIPGLADMHAHLAREEDLLLYLARGVTTVRNMWGAPIHVAWRERIQKGELIGPAIYTAGPILDGESPVHDGSWIVRTPEDADRAVAAHKRAGYDFVKVYSRLPAPAYARVVEAAKAAGLPIAGHVPRAVGLAGVLDARQDAVEHLTGTIEELQADGSPVRGKFDRASIEKKIEFVDETKLPALARRVRERGVWSCPTRVVLDEVAPAEARERLALPEMRYVLPLFPAMWQPRPDPPPDALANLLASQQRTNALHDRIIRALRDAGARLLVGTDTGNPLIVPGFSVERELALLVHAGLTPYEALRAATRDPAEFMGRAAEVGTVAVGQRADLILLAGNPLRDVHEVGRIAGVMARGRWFDERELNGMLARVEAYAKGTTDPFAGRPGLPREGTPEFSAKYDQFWKGARFGVEELLVVRTTDGGRVVRARSYDGQFDQRTSIRIRATDAIAGDGVELVLESDGSQGRGQVEVLRAAGRATIRGTLLSGDTVSREEPLPPAALLGPAKFLASWALVGPRLGALAVGNAVELDTRELAVGSSADLTDAAVRVLRLDDASVAFRGAQLAARRFEITPAKGPKSVLSLDPAGWPLGLQFEAFGATVEYTRTE